MTLTKAVLQNETESSLTCSFATKLSRAVQSTGHSLFVLTAEGNCQFPQMDPREEELTHHL